MCSRNEDLLGFTNYNILPPLSEKPRIQRMTEPMVLNAIGNKEEKSRPSSSAEDVVKKLRVIQKYFFLSHILIRMAEDITFLARSA